MGARLGGRGVTLEEFRELFRSVRRQREPVHVLFFRMDLGVEESKYTATFICTSCKRTWTKEQDAMNHRCE